MNGSKFGQRKNTGYPVFLFIVLPPASIELRLRNPILIVFRINLVNIWSNFWLNYFWINLNIFVSNEI